MTPARPELAAHERIAVLMVAVPSGRKQHAALMPVVDPATARTPGMRTRREKSVGAN